MKSTKSEARWFASMMDSRCRSARRGMERASISPSFPRTRRRSISASSIPSGRREIETDPLAAPHGSGLARLCRRPSAGPALWLPRAWSLRAAPRPSLQSAQAPDRPLCAAALRPRALARRALRLSRAAHRGDLTLDRRDSAADRAEGHRRGSEPFLGDDRPPRRAWRETRHLRGACQGPDAAPSGHPAPRCAAPTTALGHPAIIEHLLKLGVTAVELLPIHAFVDDRFLVEKGLRNYWGYSTLNFFAPEPRYSRRAGADRPQERHPLAARGRHRGAFSTSSTTIPPRADISGRRCRSAASTMRATTSSRPTMPRHDCDCDRHRQHAEPRIIRACCSWCWIRLRHWVEAYHVDGFRFDLASTLGARSARLRSQRSRLPPGRRPGSGAARRQADRRALGRRVGRLSGSAAFPPGWRSGTTSSATPRAASGAAIPVNCRNCHARARRARARSSSLRGASPGPRSTSSPLMTVSRCTTSSATTTAQRGEWRGQPGRPRPQPVVAIAASRGRADDPGDPALCGRARSATSWRRCILAQGVPMLLMGDELSRSQSGNNNAYAPGQRDRAGSTGQAGRQDGPRSARLHAGPGRLAQALRTPSGDCPISIGGPTSPTA